MRINNNISALTTRNSLATVNRDMSKSLQKLSTGLRINTAADDAAGLGVSENLRTQVRGMSQAMRNAQDAIALLNIADGALNEQAAIMQRMRELVIQAKNDTYTQTERDYMGKEFNALMSELDRIAASTKYNGMTIFAVPEQSGNYSGGIYDDVVDGTADPETAHLTQMASILPGGGALGANDGGSGHHFNMMIGQNYTETDASAFDATDDHNFYDQGAENMLTIAFGQMDSNALFFLAPNNAAPDVGIDGDGVLGDFSWDPAGDMGDIVIDWAVGGGMTPGTGTVGDKLDLILRVIDGGSTVSADMKANVFSDPTAQNPTGLERINKMRAYIGAMTNRLEHTINNLMNQETNTQSAESLIRDVDFANETARYTRNQILTQSSTAMLAQANTATQQVLQLLQ